MEVHSYPLPVLCELGTINVYVLHIDEEENRVLTPFTLKAGAWVIGNNLTWVQNIVSPKSYRRNGQHVG